MSTSAVSTFIPTGTWQLDPVHSSVTFEIPYLGGAFRGEVRNVDATLEVADAGARLAGRAPTSAIDAKDENLSAHLQGPDFFDAPRYPELRFEADQLRFEDGRVEADGELTVRGVTRDVALGGSSSGPLTDAFGRERIGLRLSTTFDRTEFGLDWNLPLPSGEPALANDVTLSAELFFVKA